jgi:uncharacterized protein YprB with RNaseH-like and TPR domain
MVVLNTLSGSVVDTDCQFICHVANCVCCKSGITDLGAAIKTKWPMCDVYSHRPKKTANTTSDPSLPGTFIALPTPDKKNVIALMSMWAPGKAGKWAAFYNQQLQTSYDDTAADRLEWFKSALHKLAYEYPNSTMAVPHKIGCESAGGNWDDYLAVLVQSPIKFKIYKYVPPSQIVEKSVPTKKRKLVHTGNAEQKRIRAPINHITGPDVANFFAPPHKKRKRSHEQCAFDTETNGVDDPVKITCAATRHIDRYGHVVVKTWHSDYATCMSHVTATALCEYLVNLHNRNVPIITYNGAGFDMQHLHQIFIDADDHEHAEQVRRLAWDGYDIMYQFMCTHGYPTSMNSILLGSNLSSKTGSGKDAIDAWIGPNATKSTKNGVLDYCASDVNCLASIYDMLVEKKQGVRYSKAGKRSYFSWKRMLTVEQATNQYNMDPPDVSWMKDPIDPLRSVRWIETHASQHKH